MKSWITGAIAGAALYIIINLAFLLSGNPQYQSMVNRDILKNIIPFITWTLIGLAAGFLIGWIIGKIKSRNSEYQSGFGWVKC